MWLPVLYLLWGPLRLLHLWGLLLPVLPSHLWGLLLHPHLPHLWLQLCLRGPLLLWGLLLLLALSLHPVFPEDLWLLCRLRGLWDLPVLLWGPLFPQGL